MAYVCPSCWNPVNWCESFNKFGHGDGDDCVHTGQVARVLREAGYFVEVFEGMHNPHIVTVAQEGEPGELVQFYADDMPKDNNPGYTDPREILPQEVVALLDRVFGAGQFFG